MEDDKLDFGDLDDFDIPQDGLGDDFSTGIEDLAELERELGLDGLNDDTCSQSVASSSTTPAVTAVATMSGQPKKDLPASLSERVTVPTSANEIKKSTLPSSSTHANESPSSTSRPFAARAKQPYSNSNNNRYQQYNNSNQQSNFMNMPYPGMNQFNMMPLVGGTLPFGQGFMNMPLPNGMMYNSNHNSNMPADPPPSRRIHVNPKFAGARPPPIQSNHQAETEAEQRRIIEQLRSEQAERRRRQTEDQARLTQQKRSIDDHQPDQHNTASPMGSNQRRRIDTASESTRSHEAPPSSSIQSRLGRGIHEVPVSVSKRNPTVTPPRPNGSNGFSIRGAAAAAAASTNNRVQQDKTGHQDQHNNFANERPLSFRSVSSTGAITNRLGTNNQSQQQQQQQQQQPSRGLKAGNKETILQRLGGGKITNKMTKKNDTSSIDHQKPSSPSLSSKASNLAPIFANGKSSKLILSNLPSQVTESSLKSLEPKDIKLVSLDRGNKSATLLFSAIDSAVTFRRKYNRTMLSGEHILVSFAKN